MTIYKGQLRDVETVQLPVSYATFACYYNVLHLSFAG